MEKSCKILIVEDDNAIRMLYEKFLTLSGYNVIGTAKNGDEAINKYKSFSDKPDIILMDNYMPVKDGIQTTLEISRFNENSKIIFTSANKLLKSKALDAGAAAFLEKPFSLQDLVTTIDTLLQGYNIVKLKKNQKIPD